ncbi:hypothetical protein QQF09_14345, partial [Clostridium perfringens]
AVSLVFAATLSILPFNNSNVYAQNSNMYKTIGIESNMSMDNIQESFQKMEDIATNSREVTGDMLDSIKSKFTNDLAEKKFKVQTNASNLDLDNAKVLEISNENGIFKSITLPIIGEEYTMFSSLTVLYDENNEIASYSESLITKSENNTFQVASYIDGEEISKLDTGIDYLENEILENEMINIKEITKEMETYGPEERGIGAIAACIAAVAGVNGVVAKLIAATCIASCPTVVPICVACIGGVAAMGSASIAAIVQCFKL